MLYQLSYEATDVGSRSGPEIFSGFFTQLHKLRSLRRSPLHSHFISAVHIWFISYIINKKSFIMHSTFEKEGIALSLLDMTNCVTWEKYPTLFPGVVVISIVACLFRVKQTNKQNNKKQNKANNGKDNQTIKKKHNYVKNIIHSLMHLIISS